MPAASLAMRKTNLSFSFRGLTLFIAILLTNILIGADRLLEFTKVWPLARVYFLISLIVGLSSAALNCVARLLKSASPSGSLNSTHRSMVPAEKPCAMRLSFIAVSLECKGTVGMFVPSASSSSFCDS